MIYALWLLMLFLYLVFGLIGFCFLVGVFSFELSVLLLMAGLIPAWVISTLIDERESKC